MAYSGEQPEKKEITLTDQVVYLGDKNTNGSWRFFVDAGDLKIQIRVAGVWTDKDTIGA
jgi:hypothetical protein